MGKVRNGIPNDDAGIAQWVYRKLTNHNPMSERETGSVATRKALVGNRPRVEIDPADDTRVTYLLNDGREYEIKVTEVSGKR